MFNNSIFYDWDDYQKRHKSKFLRNQFNYGMIEQLNVDRNCNVESVLELAILAPQQISKRIMDKHTKVLKEKYGHIFSECLDD